MADNHNHNSQVIGPRFTPEFLQLFTDLASLDLKTRTNAGTTLLKIVIEKQAEFEKAESKSGDHCRELQYTVKRLAKGLASSRDGARQGFATVLTENVATSGSSTNLIQILKSFSSVSTKYALDIIMAENEVKGKEIKGKAPREQLFGRIFGLATLARSKRLETDVASLSKSEVETYMQEVAAVIIGELLRDAKKKEFLGELCYDVVGTTLSQIKKEHYEKHILPLLLPRVSAPSEELTPEALLLLIYMRKTFKFDVTTLGAQWKSSKLVSSKNFPALKPALMKAASAFPKFHSVWQHLFAELASRDAPGAFVESLKEIFDECLAMDASKTARFMGLHVMAMLFDKIDGTIASIVLTPKVVDSLAKTATLKKEVSYQAAKRVLIAITKSGARSEEAAAALIDALQAGDHSKSFDAKSQTKTVAALLAHVGTEKAREYLMKAINDFSDVQVKEEDLEGESNAEAGKQKITDIKRMLALDQIYFMLRTPLAFKSEELTIYALKFLFFHAYYVQKDGKKAKGKKDEEDELLSKLAVKVNPELSARIRNNCKERLFSLLDFVYKAAKTTKTSDEDQEKGEDAEEKSGEEQESEEEKKDTVNGNKTLDGVNLMKDGEFWGNVLVKFQAQLDNWSQCTRKTAIQDEEATEGYKAGLALLSKIRKMVKSNEAQARRLRAFESLIIFVLLEFNNVPEETADLVPEIEVCLQKIFEESPKKSKKTEKSPKKKHADHDHEHDEEATPLEVLTDVLVGLLVKESHLLREIVSQVFVAFLNDWSAACIQILVSAVEDPESVIDIEDVNDEDEDDDAAMDLDEFQTKFLKEEASDDDEDEEESSEDKDVKMKESKAKDAKAKDVKNKKDDKTKDGKKDKKQPEPEEESDEEMDDLPPANDEEMFKMDEGLSKMFAERKELKKKRKDQEHQLAHFRVRVLALLDLYVKKMIHSNTLQSPFVYKLLAPLLNVIKDCLKKKDMLAKPCTNVYNRIIKVAKPAENNNDIAELQTILDKVLAVGLKSNVRHIIDLSRAGVAFVIRCLIHIGKTPKNVLGSLDLKVIREKFSNAYEVLATKKNTALGPDFYAPFMSNNIDLGWALVDIVSKFVKKSQEPLKGMQLILTLIKKQNIPDEYKDKLKGLVADWTAGYRATITKDKKPPRTEFSDMNKCTTSVLRTFVTAFDVKTMHQHIDDWVGLLEIIGTVSQSNEYARKQAVVMTSQQLLNILRTGSVGEISKEDLKVKKQKKKEQKKQAPANPNKPKKNKAKYEPKSGVRKGQKPAVYVPQPPKENNAANGAAGQKRKLESNGNDKWPVKKQKN